MKNFSLIFLISASGGTVRRDLGGTDPTDSADYKVGCREGGACGHMEGVKLCSIPSYSLFLVRVSKRVSVLY